MRVAAIFAAVVAVSLAAPALPQSNDNDYTPLNSRISRDRQFPTELLPKFDPSIWTSVQKDRSKDMIGQLANCIFRRSHQDAYELLEKTDLGFYDFKQIGLESEKALRIYGFHDCLGRVAYNQGGGVQLRFSAGSLRQWELQQAYFDRYPKQPDWIRPGWVITSRGELPLSEKNAGVRNSLDFADCVVGSDPYGADLYFRTGSGSEAEQRALQDLVPDLGPCLPQGVQMQIQPLALRAWLGEALWYAAGHIAPPAEDAPTSGDGGAPEQP